MSKSDPQWGSFFSSLHWPNLEHPSGATPTRSISSFSQETHWNSLCFLLRSLAKPQHKQRRPYQAPAANTSAEQRIYLNLPLALEALRGPRQGASPTCLRIHSHLRIKFLTLMLLVMLGAAPVFNPCRSTAILNMFRSEKRTTVSPVI